VSRRRKAKAKVEAPPPPPSSPPVPPDLVQRLRRWIDQPQPILRLELVRIFVPLAILGFMSTRLAHADAWIGLGGFTVPDLGKPDWRQPLYLPPVATWQAWLVAAALVISGLMVSIGARARHAALVFAACLAYVALADRLASFTVSKLAPVLAFALFLSPCGTRWSVDAWLRRRRGAGGEPPREVASGSVRFFQCLLVVIYASSGLCKARRDWLEHTYVLWNSLHDSYQTAFAWMLANALPAFAWTLAQAAVLAFEVFAPAWFGMSRTRTWALGFAVAMHLFIGLTFGPVIWFAGLMISLLLPSYLPDRVLDAWLDRVPVWLFRRYSGSGSSSPTLR
jgi:hypothetical protein